MDKMNWLQNLLQSGHNYKKNAQTHIKDLRARIIELRAQITELKKRPRMIDLSSCESRVRELEDKIKLQLAYIEELRK